MFLVVYMLCVVLLIAALVGFALAITIGEHNENVDAHRRHHRPVG